MSAFMKDLKAEIARLARREIRKSMTPLKRLGAARRRQIADLRRQISALQQELKNVSRAKAAAALPEAGEGQGRFWITGKGVRKLRLRLGLTQTEFAQLANVSGQTVVNWEGTAGKIPLRRKDSAARLQEIRKMKKRDLKKAADAKAPAKAKAKRKAKAKAKAKAAPKAEPKAE